MKGIILNIAEITDSREVMESKEPPHICWFIYILLFILLTAVISSCFFEVDEYSKVSGEIKTLQVPSSIISPTSSKVSKIFIKEGKKVKKGDILFTLDVNYAKEQYGIYKKKWDIYNHDLKESKILRTSFEKNKNMFRNDIADSKYYYRFEQYKNGILLTAEDTEKSQKKSDLSKEENKNNLETTNTSIAEKEGLLSGYKNLIYCIENNQEFLGNNDLLTAEYSEYEANYQKLVQLCNQNKASYESLSQNYNGQAGETFITALDIQTAKQEMETAFSDMSSYKAAYLSDIKSKILSLQNWLIREPGNQEIKDYIDGYTELTAAVEQDKEYKNTNPVILNSFNQYTKSYSALSETYKEKAQAYHDIQNSYNEQDNSGPVTEQQVNDAENQYNSSKADLDVAKTSIIKFNYTYINAAQIPLYYCSSWPLA